MRPAQPLGPPPGRLLGKGAKGNPKGSVSALPEEPNLFDFEDDLDAEEAEEENPQEAQEAEEDVEMQGADTGADAPLEEEDDWVKEFERKWAATMSDGDTVAEEQAAPAPKRSVRGSKVAPATPAKATPTPPPPKAGMKRTAPGVGNEEQAFKVRRAPTPPMPKGAAPFTPGAGQAFTPAAGQANFELKDARIRDEHPEWASRCTIEPGRPGQPHRLGISMAEVSLGDDGLSSWCQWMERRLSAAFPSNPMQSSARTRFKAGVIDFSENKFTVAGAKALFALFEKHVVRCEVLRLTANNLGNEALRCIAKYLTAFSQAPVLEIHLSRNPKITAEGVKWFIGCLSIHPAYPVWHSESQRFMPMQLSVENAKVKGEAGLRLLLSACNAFSCSACVGESYSEEGKHNCIVQMLNWDQSDEAMEQLPSPSVHARPFFARPGRAAPKASPSEDAIREEPRLVYEDDDLAVVMKPPGWSCLPQAKGVDPAWAKLKPLAKRQQVAELMKQASTPPLQAWLLLHFGADPRCDACRDKGCDRGLVHRLDVDTSGPILVGKTLKGFEHAKKQIVAGILKDYVALVHGTFETERGECRVPVDTAPFAETKQVRADASGQPASTIWEALAEYESPDLQERYTLVHCRMATLRTHQIRVHMQYLGHPLVGDRLYGTEDQPDWCPRMFLHKFRIGFFNLQSQACMQACSMQSAPDLWKALGKLRKVGGMATVGCGAPGL